MAGCIKCGKGEYKKLDVMCHLCIKVINDEAKSVKPKLYMAEKAYHILGNISRDKGFICRIFKETPEYFVGNWEEGYGFINVVFPKETTHEIEIPTGAVIIKTRNSVYRFGKSDNEGKRNISRYKKPLSFSLCKIEQLIVGYPMMLNYFHEEFEWVTSSIKSIEEIS